MNMYVINYLGVYAKLELYLEFFLTLVKSGVEVKEEKIIMYVSYMVTVQSIINASVDVSQDCFQ